MSDVNVMVTFRHTHPTQALKNYVEQKIHRIGRFFPYPSNPQSVLSVEAKWHQQVEIDLQTRGTTIHGKQQCDDLYAAIDLAVDDIERQNNIQKLNLNRRRPKE
jgi:ribosome hibernation promoting factor